MKIKKWFASIIYKLFVIITLILILIPLIACSRFFGDRDNSLPNTDSPGKGGSKSTQITLEEGREFGSCSWIFSAADENFSSLLLDYGSSAFDDAYEDYHYHMALGCSGLSSQYLHSLRSFDDIPVGGTHLLEDLNLQGSKQASGAIFTALIDDTLGAESRWHGTAMYNPGDRAQLKAVLDTKEMTLCCESSLERNKEMFSRTVLEVVFLPDGTILSQIFHVEGSDGHTTNEYTVFKRISGNSYSCLVAMTADQDIDTIGLDYNFTYESIIGKGDITTEQMAKGRMITHVFTVEKDKVSYETK